MKILICIVCVSVFLMYNSLSLKAENLPLKEVEQLLQSGNANEAVNLLNKYIWNNPDSMQAYIILAKTLISIGTPNDRTKAEKVLETGLRKNPKNIKMLYLIADMYHEKELYEEAIKYGERIFNIQPDNKDIIDRLVNYYINQRDLEKVRKMDSFMKNAIQKNPHDAFNYLTLGKLEIETGHADKAIEILKKGIELNQDYPALHRMLSEAYLWNEQGLECTNEYYRWLELENDPIVLPREYELTQLSMNSRDAKIFENIPYRDKPQFLIKFWRINDPYPITIQSERLIEFLRRVTFVMTFYHTYKNKPGFYDVEKAIIQRGTQSVHETPVKENVFSKEKVAKTVYKYRPGREGIDPRLKYLPLAKYDPSIYKVFSNLRPLQQGELNYSPLLSEPSYEVKLVVDNLEFATWTTQFRGDNGKTKVEVAFGFPLNQLQPKSGKDSSSNYTFETDLIVHDSLAHRNLRTHGMQEFEAKPNANYSRVNFVNDEKHDIQPGDYKLTFQVIELSNNKGGFKTEPIRVRNFSGTALMISDVKFSQKIDFLGMDEKTGLEQLYVMPYPFPYVKQNTPLYIYFEVYNLFLEPGSGSKYTISFKAAKQDKEGNFITQPFRALGRIFSRGKPKIIETVNQRSGSNRTSLEYLELDLSGLETGQTRMIVTAEDELANKKVESSVEFELKN